MPDATAVPVRPPPRGFWMGFLFGLVVLTPGMALLARLFAELALVEIGGLPKLMALSAAFVALPAAISAGGVARLSARAVIYGSSVRRTSAAAALRLGIAGPALAALIAIAAGPTPDSQRWWMVAALGGAAGVVTGALLGAGTGLVARIWQREEATFAGRPRTSAAGPSH